MVWSAFTTAVPPAGPAVTASAETPSTTVSFARTPMTTTPPSATVTASPAAVGGPSSTGVTVTETVAVATCPS
ncbi:hypothetical protein PSR1_01219 [Anaeromyxobacter sp. PSR-1]|nr:hypothetical protein PSR1_01219 [Anaeromyxobacter sp. PSR-1]